MTVSRAALAAVLLTAAGLAGCNTTQKALGMGKAVPDEFRVVAKAPLVVPPEYSLRPPAPGQARPQELQPESAARVALLGRMQGEARTSGEQLFSQKAGGTTADPLAGYVVDDEVGQISHKDKSFADRVMFWRKGDPAVVVASNPGADQSAPVDAAAADAQVREVTGAQPVVIQRRKSTKIKLPGL
ncbi:MAG: DUF3035 domain-containing protein [Caulobacteraceae bacterium]